MKSIYPGFYNPSDDELDDAWTSEDTLFIFDTNTLLNLYAYASQTRDDFFSILNHVSQRIWLPYHVGLEYQRRRLSVIRDEKAVFKKVEDMLSKIDKIFDSEFSELALNRRFPVLHANTTKLHLEIKKLVTSYKKSVSHWDKMQPCVRGHDSIREKFNAAFDGKIGEIPESQKVLNEIFKDGESRYKNNVPPGYKDTSKSKDQNNSFVYAGLEYDRQYGDLVIWKQIIDKSKDEGIKSVIFVTDDAKEDWWYIINSRGEKSIGPRAELREEICREGNIELFTMYNTSGFLESGKKLLKVDIKEESIDDASKTFFDQVKFRDIIGRKFSNEISNINEFDKSIIPSSDVEKIKKIYDVMNFNDLHKLEKQLEISELDQLKSIVFDKDLDKFRKLHELKELREFDELLKRIDFSNKPSDDDK